MYAVAAAAAAYTHYTAIFVLVAQALWSLWVRRGRPLAPIVANAAVVVLYAPWLPEIHGSELGVYSVLEPLTAHNVLIDLVRLIPGYPYASLHAIPTIGGLVVFGVCVGAALIALGRTLSGRLASGRGREPSSHTRASLIVLLALATPVGLLLYSLIGTDIWDARSLYASVPAIALVVGAVLVALPRPAAIVATAAVAAVLLAGTFRSITPSYARPAFRSASEYLDHAAAPGDPIVFFPSPLGLDTAIAVQLRRPHRLIVRVPPSWPLPPPGGADYAVVDDSASRMLKIGIPRPIGFELVGRRHYSGLVAFSLFTYRPVLR